jgi:succinyl-CoA synthetase beta subunit
MRLDEHDAKTLFSTHGIDTPVGELVTSPAQAVAAASRLTLPVYVKALDTASSRAERGGVLRIDVLERVAEAFDSVTMALGADAARIEQAVSDCQEWFVAIAYLPERRGPSLLCSAQGGSGVETRAAAVREVEIDPLLGLRRFHVRRLLSGGGVESEVSTAFVEVVERLYDLFVETDAVLVEVNPLVWDGSRFVALDGRVEIDDFACRRQSNLWGLRSASGARDGSSVLRQYGIDFVQLDGRIGIIGLGAGLTMLLADWIAQEGGEPAFFCDLTTAAVRDWSALFAGTEATKFIRSAGYALDRTLEMMEVLLLNFTSGGTPVDGLFRGFFTALDARDWGGPVIAHAGGNRSIEAAGLLAARGIEAQPSLGHAVRAAVDIGAAVR